MPEVEFVDGNQILGRDGVFLNIQQSCFAKINHTNTVHLAHNFTDSVIFGAGAVIDQITQLNIIGCPPVKRVNDRKSVEPV